MNFLRPFVFPLSWVYLSKNPKWPIFLLFSNFYPSRGSCGSKWIKKPSKFQVSNSILTFVNSDVSFPSKQHGVFGIERLIFYSGKIVQKIWISLDIILIIVAIPQNFFWFLAIIILELPLNKILLNLSSSNL